MATPLGELLRQLRNDTDVQTRFHQSPAEYLHEHGWGDLDAADMQEALLLLADAAPAAEAGAWIAAGETVDPMSGDAAVALDAAVTSLHDGEGSTGLSGDTDDLDETEAFGDPGDLDGIATIVGGPTEPSESVSAPSPTDASAPPEPDIGAIAEPVDEIDDEIVDDLVDAFDPTAPDTPPHPDTPLTEDLADPIGHDLDPEPDWDDPS